MIGQRYVPSMGSVQEVSGFSSISTQAGTMVADSPAAPLLETPHTFISEDAVIQFGGIPDPVTSDRRVSDRIQSQPDADDWQMDRASRIAKLKDAESSTGYLPNYRTDPHMVVTNSYGSQGAYGYWVCPLGDGSTGYLQPVWMAAY
uniref:Uncharacterized protein n=1 Tax=Hordeum vulgare subsp. vulgare TaxID=112509 RepID=A0A8I6W8S0_HORVV